MTTADNDAAVQPPTLWARIRRLGLPEGQTLVWWLIEHERGLPRQILSFLAFLVSFRFLFGWTWSMSLAMVVSMFLHECGHAFVLWRAGIRFLILYLFPLGAVAAPIDKDEDARSDQLPWNTISWLLQAGLIVNVLLMLLFTALQSVTALDNGVEQFARDMVYVNGLLAAMNLIPLWTLDSGQLFKVLYNSLKEQEDNWLTAVLLVGTALVLLFAVGVPGFLSWTSILVNAILRLGWIIFLIVFAIGILNKQGRDNPLYAYSRQAMSGQQVVGQVIIYLALVGITLWMFAGPLV
jgi:Zn-dependent protease